MNDVSIVIPCLDDGKGLETLLPQVRRVMCHFKIPAAVVVIDGGSKDDTIEVATRHGAAVWKQRGEIIIKARKAGQLSTGSLN